jgi:hypothetical protein
VFRITAVEVSASSNPGENRFAFVDWVRESFGVEFSLPRKAFSIPVFDNERLAHSAVLTTYARLRFVELDSPDMPATVTYRFVLFHRISVSALY